MSDMFGPGIRKTDNQGIGRSDQTPEANYAQQAESARLSELGFKATHDCDEASATPSNDGVQFTEDTAETNPLNLSNALQAAWSSPTRSSGPPQLRILQGPPTGLNGGFVMNSKGFGNLEPGMHAGGVYLSP